MKKGISLAMGVGLLFFGQSGLVHADTTNIQLNDVTLKYYNILDVQVTEIADFAFGGLHHPDSTDALAVSGQGAYDGSYDFILKLNTITGQNASSNWVTFSPGLDFKISGLNTANAGGAFTVEWQGTSLPTYFDFVFGFGIGTTQVNPNISYYGFDEIYLSNAHQTANGTYAMTFVNPGTQFPDLSHLMVYGNMGETPPPAVPEPATMLLFGTGLAGLAAVARRRKN